jgi:hypothetical protein
MNDAATVTRRPRTIPLADVARDLNLSVAAVRRAIDEDIENKLPDDQRCIPGGRVFGATYYVLARPYELVTCPLPQPADLIKRRAS